MKNFREYINERSTIRIDVSKLDNDDREAFIDEFEGYGLKTKDWDYDGLNTIVIPSKYKKYLKDWELTVIGTIRIDVSKLDNDDREAFIDELESYGLKAKDWYYDGGLNTIVIPSKYKKYLKDWELTVENSKI